MASRTSSPNRGGGRPNSNSRQSSQSHSRPWRERSPAAPFQGDHQSSAICEDRRTDFTTNNNIDSSRGFILSQPHYAQPHYAQPNDVYYYTSYATVPLQSTPTPAARHYMINNNYHNSPVPCIQTSIPAPQIQRPSNQPQSSGIWRSKSQGKVVNSKEHAVKRIGQAPECLVSLMENMELIPGPDTSSLTDFRMVIPALPKLLPSEEIDKDLATNPMPLVAIRRPDSGGKEGALI